MFSMLVGTPGGARPCVASRGAGHAVSGDFPHAGDHDGRTGRRFISGSAVRGRRSCCSTASATPATCGRPWRRSSRGTIPWWCPTCAAWASPRIPPAAMTSARKRPTCGPSSPTWASSGRSSSGTTSAPWSPMPMPPAIPRETERAGGDGCAGPRHPPLGRPRAPPPALAFLLRRPGCRAARRGTRAHLSRPLLERVRRRPREDR